ncbi:hypothetical protein ARTHRO9V_90159 [Arthrobacter sp. 9V]|nr:hypothetical protein ARTHRO9V_90159 [Arthrobacter sp. 9V]
MVVAKPTANTAATAATPTSNFLTDLFNRASPRAHRAPPVSSLARNGAVRVTPRCSLEYSFGGTRRSSSG